MPKLNYESQTPKTLAAIATDLERTAAALRARLEALREDKIETLDVPNYTILTKGMEFIEKFVFAVRKAHLDAREASGAYRSRPSAKRRARRKKQV